METLDSNGDSPATQHDLALFAGRFTERFDQLDERLRGVDGRFADIDERNAKIEGTMATKQELSKVLRIQEAILTTVQSIDGRLQDMADHTERIIRLEEEAFGPSR
jgi:hypothetical protein